MIDEHEFPGLAGGFKGTVVSRSAAQWAGLKHEAVDAAKVETSALTAEGFQEGVTELLANSHNQGVYEALVFRSSGGAAQRLKATISEAHKTLGKSIPVVRLSTPGIPGSILYSEFSPREQDGASNVLFATGRCTFVVSDALSDISTRAAGSTASIALATSVYRRAKRLCA